jgi:hypothetical protein
VAFFHCTAAGMNKCSVVSNFVYCPVGADGVERAATATGSELLKNDQVINLQIYIVFATATGQIAFKNLNVYYFCCTARRDSVIWSIYFTKNLFPDLTFLLKVE